MQQFSSRRPEGTSQAIIGCTFWSPLISLDPRSPHPGERQRRRSSQALFVLSYSLIPLSACCPASLTYSLFHGLLVSTSLISAFSRLCFHLYFNIFLLSASAAPTNTWMSVTDTRSTSEIHLFIHFLAVAGSFDHMSGSNCRRLPPSGLLETWTHKH